ncbi:MAG TPA: hypothetical protein PLK80_04255 [bacterium]|nr:hypothetical protein [bacterium]
MVMNEEADNGGIAGRGRPADSRAESLIYDYHRARLERDYADIDDADELKSFFFEKIYPPPEARAALEGRNRSIRRIIRNPFFKIVFHPVTVRTARQLLELDKLTNDANRRIDEEMRKSPPPCPLDDDAYFKLCRAATTEDESRRRLECAMDVFNYSRLLIEGFPNLRDVFKVVPAPLLKIAGGALEFGIHGYNTLLCHRERLQYYMETIERRESDRIEKIFGGSGDAAAQAGGD